MKSNIVNDISPPIPYLAKLWFSICGLKCCWLIKLQDSLKGNISVKFIFGIQIKVEVFYKLILSFWVRFARHVQSTQNKKFAYLCNISRKTWGMNLIVCLQINTCMVSKRHRVYVGISQDGWKHIIITRNHSKTSIIIMKHHLVVTFRKLRRRLNKYQY